MLGLADAAVPPGQTKRNPISEPSRPDRGRHSCENGADIPHAYHRGSPVVRRPAEDGGHGAVHDVIPREIEAIQEAGPHDVGEVDKNGDTAPDLAGGLRRAGTSGKLEHKVQLLYVR